MPTLQQGKASGDGNEEKQFETGFYRDFALEMAFGDYVGPLDRIILYGVM